MVRLRPKTLGGLIAVVGLGFAMLVSVLSLSIYWMVHQSIEQHLDDRIHAEAEALLAGGDPRGLPGVLEAVKAREAKHGAGDLGYIVADAQGRRVGGTLNSDLPRPGYTEFLHYRLANGERGVAQAINVDVPGGGQLVVAAERAAVDRMDNAILAMFGAAMTLIILVGVGSAIALRRVVNRRLALMGSTAEAIMAGDLSRRMPLLGDDEFDQVSAVINRMLERIEALMDNLRQLSANIAHDIRSPLTRVRNTMEGFAAHEQQAVPAQIASEAIGEIDELLRLLSGLLGIAEIEGFAVRKRFVPVDLFDLASDVVEGYRPTVEAAGAAIRLRGSSVRISGDESLLRRCLANLIDNAILHARGMSQIDVELDVRDRNCLLRVTDDGVGIPDEAIGTIFRRFVRLDRSRSTAGHGLGLALVEAITKAHYGKARVVPDGKGAIIELDFPR